MTGRYTLRQRSPMMSILWFIVGFALVAAVYTWLIFDYWPVVFVLMMVGCAYSALAGYSIIPACQPGQGPLAKSSALFNLLVGVAALIGLLAMFYDRTSLRGIDYANLGLAAARAEFNRLGERGGIISILGNLMSAAVYFPLVNLIMDWEKWHSSVARWSVLVVVVLGIVGLTYITGGRTALLIGVAMAAAAMLARGALGLPRLPSFLTPSRLALVSLVVLLSFGLIFALRATAFGAASAADYLSRLCIHLSQPAIEIMEQCYSLPYSSGISTIEEIANYGTAVLLYAFHVAWVGDVIISDTNPGAPTSFAGIQDMFLSRFGYNIDSTEYDGYFIPAGANLIFDFGVITMVAGFFILGVALAVFRNGLLVGRLFRGRIAFAFLASWLLLSVMISPTNLPIVILSALLTVGIALGNTIARGFGFDLVHWRNYKRRASGSAGAIA